MRRDHGREGPQLLQWFLSLVLRWRPSAQPSLTSASFHPAQAGAGGLEVGWWCSFCASGQGPEHRPQAAPGVRGWACQLHGQQAQARPSLRPWRRWGGGAFRRVEQGLPGGGRRPVCPASARGLTADRHEGRRSLWAGWFALSADRAHLEASGAAGVRLQLRPVFSSAAPRRAVAASVLPLSARGRWGSLGRNTGRGSGTSVRVAPPSLAAVGPQTRGCPPQPVACAWWRPGVRGPSGSQGLGAASTRASAAPVAVSGGDCLWGRFGVGLGGSLASLFSFIIEPAFVLSMNFFASESRPPEVPDFTA